MNIFSATCDSRDHQMGSDPTLSWDYRLQLLIFGPFYWSVYGGPLVLIMQSQGGVWCLYFSESLGGRRQSCTGEGLGLPKDPP